MDPVTRLLELDERYRLVLHSSDFVAGEIWNEVQPEMKQKFLEVEAEIDDLRTTHPNLFRKLEGLYRAAKPDRPMTTDLLVDFAYQEHLLLTGERYLGPFRAPDMQEVEFPAFIVESVKLEGPPED